MSATTTTARRTMSIRRVSGLLFVTIKVKGQKDATYTVQPIPGSPGVSYTFAKHGSGEIYDVHVDPAEGVKTCCCKGHTYHGHCKHADCLEALWTTGRLAN